jgi:hypothetical protein
MTLKINEISWQFKEKQGIFDAFALYYIIAIDRRLK